MVSPHFFHIEGIAAACTIVALGWGLIKLTFHAIDSLSGLVKVVRHMYVNEIPHMERALRRICEKMGIDYDDPPVPPIEL